LCLWGPERFFSVVRYAHTPTTLSRLILGVVIARPERPWQSPALERFEIAASAFGLLAMTPTNSILTDYYPFPGCAIFTVYSASTAPYPRVPLAGINFATCPDAVYQLSNPDILIP